MMLDKVLLATDVALACTQHALSTEKEEIMGLLIGEVLNNGSIVSIVSSVILRRLDKKPDRVEISEEQLVQATMRAEELATELGRPLRVVGWYHSHPHITVWPSHVDLATQFMYQRMDPSFVGIIFAVYLTEQTTKAPSDSRRYLKSCQDHVLENADFHETTGHTNLARQPEVQITCFQSVSEGSTQGRREIDLQIVNNNDSLIEKNFEIITQLPAILKEEEDEAYSNQVGYDDNEDIIVKQHNAAVQTIAIGHIVEKMSRPMLESFVTRNTINSTRLKVLKKLHQELMHKVENISNSLQ